MSRCKPTGQRADSGFSLLELFIVLSLLGIFIGGVQESVIVGLRAASSADEREDIRGPVTSALELLVREASVASNIDKADTDVVQFDTPSVNNVEYKYDSATQTLSHDDADTPQRVIVRNLTAFDFDYVDCQGASYTGTVPGAAEDTLRVVQVTATVAKGAETISVTNSAFLRNMLGQESGTCGSL